MSAFIKQQQQDWLDWELGVFFHFGIRTFNEGHFDWDMEEMKLETFNPTRLDCGQWMDTLRQAGAKYAVLVCKHHDGFANWPSKYTDYSVANTPWLDGKGDVVRQFVDACRAYGIKVGLYYSPAEFGFKARDAAAYDDYFINQIGELLTNYGKIDYLWFDGNGSAGHQYDTKRIVAEIRRLQPEILLFNMWDPDSRWCGNESGQAHAYNPYVVSGSTPMVYTEALIDPDRSRFLPVECDIRMRLRNWFYSDHDEDTVKSVDELMGIYDYSVGRGCNLLINIGPNREGLLPQKDAERLIAFGQQIQQRFANPLAVAVTHDQNAYTVELETPGLVQMAVLQEALSADNWVERFRIECYPYAYGDPIAVYHGRTIGHKAICTFPAFYTQKIRIVAESGEMRLDDIKVYAAK